MSLQSALSNLLASFSADSPESSGPGETELGAGVAGDRNRVGDGRNEGAADVAVPAGKGTVGSVNPDGLARSRAGRPDALQGPVQYRVIRVELTAQRERQVPGADVQAIDTVDGQGGVQIGNSVSRLRHDEAERFPRGQHAA